MTTGQAALQRLLSGNQRFVSGRSSRDALASLARRRELVSGQNPFATVLSCSDSRVPAELVFDQDLGDLFVIRVAGNIAAPSQIGSVEFAVEQLGTPLVLVLGHSACGAISAALDELTQAAPSASNNLRTILDRVLPSVRASLDEQPKPDRDALIEHAVRANVRRSMDELCRGSALLAKMVRSDRLLVAGAEYCMATGVVDCF